MYAETDIQDAVFAQTINNDMKINQCSLRDSLTQFMYEPSDKREYSKLEAEYRHGNTLLESAKIVSSGKFSIGCGHLYTEHMTELGATEFVMLSSGFVGTSEMYRWYGLVAK